MLSKDRSGSLEDKDKAQDAGCYRMGFLKFIY